MSKFNEVRFIENVALIKTAEDCQRANIIKNVSLNHALNIQVYRVISYSKITSN